MASLTPFRYLAPKYPGGPAPDEYAYAYPIGTESTTPYYGGDILNRAAREGVIPYAVASGIAAEEARRDELKRISQGQYGNNSFQVKRAGPSIEDQIRQAESAYEASLTQREPILQSAAMRGFGQKYGKKAPKITSKMVRGIEKQNIEEYRRQKEQRRILEAKQKLEDLNMAIMGANATYSQQYQNQPSYYNFLMGRRS